MSKNQMTMGIAMDRELVKKLDEIAKREHRSRSNFIEVAIRKIIEEDGKK